MNFYSSSQGVTVGRCPPSTSVTTAYCLSNGSLTATRANLIVATFLKTRRRKSVACWSQWPRYCGREFVSRLLRVRSRMVGTVAS